MAILVKNFFCVFPLETGGLIIGWTNLVLDVLIIILLIICPFVSPLIFPENFAKEKGLLAVVSIGCIIVIAVYGSLTYLSYRFIEGIKTRNFQKVQPFRFLCIIGLILYSLNILGILNQGAGNSEKSVILEFFIVAILTAIRVYEFIIVDSLFMKFKNEAVPPGANPYNLSVITIASRFNVAPPVPQAPTDVELSIPKI
ncbi:CLUMA_CG018671, isoform A [Clunio marinus]|uniref:CLUMA_CG018671, isoform A n=1 Tax=Clunio marinus TaxID=568069 RepID=A0A1J1IYQ1_9DIPT|nr:CLUMA_CG018671, isoform A [Clunio marinus]